MTKRHDDAGGKANIVPNRHDKQSPPSAEETKVWEVLEQARQNVKPIVKKEKEAEVLTGELLNLRLKAI